MNTLPAWVTFSTNDASGMLRCSGANRFAISTASSRDRTRITAEFRAIDLLATFAVGSTASCRSSSFATAPASRFDVVNVVQLLLGIARRKGTGARTYVTSLELAAEGQSAQRSA